MSTPEERLSALETWRTGTVDPGLVQARTALTNQAQRLGTLETAGASLDARLTKLVTVLKRVGPAVRDILSLVSTQAANRDAILPEDERVERARRREDVMNSDFTINGS